MSYDEAKAKKRKILILELIVILMVIPAVFIYYEYNVAKQNNEQIMQEHAITDNSKLLSNSSKAVPVGNLPSSGGH